MTTKKVSFTAIQRCAFILAWKCGITWKKAMRALIDIHEERGFRILFNK